MDSIQVSYNRSWRLANTIKLYYTLRQTYGCNDGSRARQRHTSRLHIHKMKVKGLPAIWQWSNKELALKVLTYLPADLLTLNNQLLRLPNVALMVACSGGSCLIGAWRKLIRSSKKIQSASVVSYSPILSVSSGNCLLQCLAISLCQSLCNLGSASGFQIMQIA